MMYLIVRNITGENLLYVEQYDRVVWIHPDKLHKYYEDSFLFSFEQMIDLTSNLLIGEDVTIYCLEYES